MMTFHELGWEGTVADFSSPTPDLRLAFCDATQLRAIRHWLREHLIDDAQAIDAELVATELVTNAIDHGGGAVAVRIVLALPGRVRVEVDDNNPSVALTVGTSRFGGHRGNGLAIIDTAAAWGVDGTETGKTVWAELPPVAAGAGRPISTP